MVKPDLNPIITVREYKKGKGQPAIEALWQAELNRREAVRVWEEQNGVTFTGGNSHAKKN